MVNELAKANDRDAKPIVVVVSPLVALMEDQVKEAEKLGVCAGQLGVHDDHCTAFAADPKRPQRRIVNDYTQHSFEL